MSERLIEEILFAMQGQKKIDSVPNLFADGLPCEQLYSEVYDANRRLCERLGGAEEDDDVELIITNLLRIADIQSVEMFRFAWKLAKGEIEV